jgi:hypothetical protein
MNATKKGIEVRAFGISRPGIECPSRHKRRRKPTSEQTIQELYEELDYIEARGLAPDAEHDDGAAVQPADDDADERHRQAAIERLRRMAASGSNYQDDSRELAEMGLTTWSPTQRR